MTTTGVNVLMRARSNGVDTRIADLFRWHHVTKKKTMDDESERREEKKRRWSARAEQHADSLIGGGTAGAADANSVTTTTTQHTITGGLELEMETNLRGLEWSWYVAWSWCRR